MGQEHHLAFGPFHLDDAPGHLWQGDQAIPLRPQSLALLRYLVEHAGRLVTRDRAVEAVAPLIQQGGDGGHAALDDDLPLDVHTLALDRDVVREDGRVEHHDRHSARLGDERLAGERQRTAAVGRDPERP